MFLLETSFCVKVGSSIINIFVSMLCNIFGFSLVQALNLYDVFKNKQMQHMNGLSSN